MNPLVTVITPVFNGEKYIQECIESVLSQDYSRIEYIVVDDGSTDRTPEIVSEYKDKLVYVRQDNAGAAAALNAGLRRTNGSHVAWLSHDDVFMPHKTSRQVKVLCDNPSLALVYSDCSIIDRHGQELSIKRPPCPPYDRFVFEMLRGFFVTSQTMLIRRECIEKVGHFDERLVAYQDADMQFRLLKSFRFGYVPGVLVKYRWHSGNQSHKRRLCRKWTDEVLIKALHQFGPDEVFGADCTSSCDGKRIASRYEGLAVALGRRLAFKSAAKALDLAIQHDSKLKRRVLKQAAQFAGTGVGIEAAFLLARLYSMRHVIGRLQARVG